MAQNEGVSLNQFFLYAIANTVSEVETRRFFEAKGSQLEVDQAERRYREVLGRVRDRPADPGDEVESSA